jgi:HNH endonuclease
MLSCSDPATVGPKGGRPRLDIPKVLEERTMWEPMSGCRLWLGPWDGLYGTIGQKKAHRVAYEYIKGPIPEGLVLDHLCRVTICINPNHLEPVTDAVNIRRGYAVRDRCPQGHTFEGDNLIFTRLGHRICRTCRDERNTRGRRQDFRTHCPHGHPFAGDNLIITRRGHRQCRTCQRDSERRWRRRNRAKERKTGER